MGHDAGDQLLATVASRVSACLRKSDTVARLGGEEFAMILPVQRSTASGLEPQVVGSGDIDLLAGVLDLLKRIQREIALPISLNGQEVIVTSSMGACFFP